MADIRPTPSGFSVDLGREEMENMVEALKGNFDCLEFLCGRGYSGRQLSEMLRRKEVQESLLSKMQFALVSSRASTSA